LWERVRERGTPSPTPPIKGGENERELAEYAWSSRPTLPSTWVNLHFSRLVGKAGLPRDEMGLELKC